MPKRARKAKRSLDALDRAAARVLAAVDETPRTQIAALAALDVLVDACDRDGVLAREVRRLRDERRASFKRFHLERAARAADRVALLGDDVRDEALTVVEAAVVLVAYVDGESGDLRGLRARLDDLRRGGAGRPRPFFARYLVHQQR